MNLELLSVVIGALDHAGIDHMVTGSMASSIHGRPRSTRDIDVVIDASSGSIEIFVAQLPESLYVGDGARAVRDRDMFNVLDTATGWKVDLIVRKDRPFSEVEFARRTPIELGGVATFIPTVEDSILSKLEWILMTPSELQRNDVSQMLTVNADELDWEYLSYWAAELGVEGELDRLVADQANHSHESQNPD